jgi:hypothetical protein
MPRWCLAVCAGVVGLGLWAGAAAPARAQDYTMSRYFYYPYYYFPHNFWPQMGPPWPEPPGAPYMPPPAYMAYPPFREPHWRYEYFQPQRYYRGFHFWLDQF